MLNSEIKVISEFLLFLFKWHSLSSWLKVKELYASFRMGFIRARVFLSKIPSEHHFYCVSNEFYVRLKLVCHRSILEIKCSCFHEYIKCQKLSLSVKRTYKIVSKDHREIVLFACHRCLGSLSRVLLQLFLMKFHFFFMQTVWKANLWAKLEVCLCWQHRKKLYSVTML